MDNMARISDHFHSSLYRLESPSSCSVSPLGKQSAGIPMNRPPGLWFITGILLRAGSIIQSSGCCCIYLQVQGDLRHSRLAYRSCYPVCPVKDLPLSSAGGLPAWPVLVE